MSDPAPLRPASALRPVISVLARTLLGRGGAGPAAGGPTARPALPLPTLGAALGAPPPLGTPARSAPGWAQALADVAPHARPLGDALTELVQAARRAAGGPSPELRAALDLLGDLGRLDDLDGPTLRDRLAAVGQTLEARLAAGVGPRRAAEGAAPDLATALGLKALLLRAQAAQPEGELGERVRRVLASLDGEQLHNLARAEHGEPPVLQLPLPDGQAWTSAWFQHRGGRGESDAGQAGAEGRLTVGLTLSALGPVRLDLALAPDLLRVRIAVARADVRAALERDLPALLADLERVGRPVAIGVELADARDLGPPIPVIDGQLDVAG